MTHADHALARRIERAEAAGARAWAEGCRRLFPESGVDWMEAAGGYAVFAGVDSPVSQVQGAGMSGAAGEEEIDRIEDFFFSRGSRVQVVVCPLADPSLLAMLGRRGYFVAEMENVLAMPLDAGSLGGPPATEVEIQRLEPLRVDEWAVAVGRGFIEQPESVPAGAALSLDENFVRMLLAGAAAEGYINFASLLRGQIIGGGGVFIYEGVGMLNGASLLAEHRRRGAHSALHHARLAHAAAAGCNLARAVTQPGSISQRNAERRGFRVVYTRAALVRTVASA